MKFLKMTKTSQLAMGAILLVPLGLPVVGRAQDPAPAPAPAASTPVTAGAGAEAPTAAQPAKAR